MISWTAILYGAALTALFTAVALVLLTHERRRGVLIAAVGASAAGPVAWNSVLRATGGAGFFTDAPIAVFPVSWQDFGSGVFAFAVAGVMLGLGALRDAHAQAATLRAALVAFIALTTDVYLY
jgi:hypothetical protein